MKISLRELGIPTPTTISANDVAVNKIFLDIKRRTNLIKSKLSITVTNDKVVIKLGRYVLTELILDGNNRTGYFLRDKS